MRVPDVDTLALKLKTGVMSRFKKWHKRIFINQ